MDLSTKTKRDRLPLRIAAYFQKLGPGCYLSFRRGPDTWGARFRTAAGKQEFATFVDPAPADFEAAKKRAEGWFAQMGGAVATHAPTRGTVADALNAYLVELRRLNRAGAAAEAERRYKTVILGNPTPNFAPVPRDPFADVRLETATREDFRAWGERVRAGRGARTVNRYLRTVAAALGVQRAYKQRVGNPETWEFAAPLSGTVEAALIAHIKQLRRLGREAAADEALRRCRAVVLGAAPAEQYEPVARDRLADMRLEATTREDFKAWRARISKGREPRTVNRYVRALAAGLNCAHSECGHVGNPEAWTLVELDDDVEDGVNTAIFLNPKQRRGFRSLMEPSAAAFCYGLEKSGARPHELMKARVCHFDATAGTVEFSHRKGRPAKLRTRVTHLCPEGVAHFQKAAAGKAPAALLFTDRNGRAWTNARLANWIRRAAKRYRKAAEEAAKAPAGTVALFEPMPAGVGAYAFRHARISELLQYGGVDPVTVAKETGTSVAMIEKTYFKFIRAALDEKLAAMNAKLATTIHAA